MKDPIEQMFVNEYVVSGTWSDPLVERVGRSAPAASAAAPAETLKQ
jgi:hypothetical protein